MQAISHNFKRLIVLKADPLVFRPLAPEPGDVFRQVFRGQKEGPETLPNASKRQDFTTSKRPRWAPTTKPTSPDPLVNLKCQFFDGPRRGLGQA